MKTSSHQSCLMLEEIDHNSVKWKQFSECRLILIGEEY